MSGKIWPCSELIDAMLYCYRKFLQAEDESEEEDYYWGGYWLLRAKLVEQLR